MTSRRWFFLIALALFLCLGLSAWLLIPGEAAQFAEVSCDGQVVEILDLRIDRSLTLATYGGGENTITVRDGRVAVTAASCPDHYCMARGFQHSGSPIVCLPNKLVITFLGESPEVDFAVG